MTRIIISVSIAACLYISPAPIIITCAGCP